MLLLPDIGARIIASHERSINDALMTLVCRPDMAHDRPIRDMVIGHLSEIADMRTPRDPLSPGFYSNPLYWDIFALDPPGNAAYRMGRLRWRFHNWTEHDPHKMVEALHIFHTKFANGCSEATNEKPMTRFRIMGLIDEFVGTMTS